MRKSVLKCMYMEWFQACQNLKDSLQAWQNLESNIHALGQLPCSNLCMCVCMCVYACVYVCIHSISNLSLHTISYHLHLLHVISVFCLPRSFSFIFQILLKRKKGRVSRRAKETFSCDLVNFHLPSRVSGRLTSLSICEKLLFVRHHYLWKTSV